MKKIFAMVVMTAMLLGLAACGANGEESGTQATPTPTTAPTSSAEATQGAEATPEPTQATEVTPEAETQTGPLTYTMQVATDDANAESTVQFPYFTGERSEALNELVKEAVLGFFAFDATDYEAGAQLKLTYEAAVSTLEQNFVSIVFYGPRDITGAAYPVYDLRALNIDLYDMKPVTLEEMYILGETFAETVFEKAYEPAAPYVPLDGLSFAEQLELQTLEFQPVSPFDVEGSVSYYFTPEELVLIFPTTHVTGNDYFEAAVAFEEVSIFHR